MQCKLIFLPLVASSALLFAPVAQADGPEHGVNAQGQPYRVDKDGNQLVDYIAELEVNVDSLEKRVYGLEDEVKEKDAEIGRLQKGEPAGGVLAERDLTKSHSVAQQACPACERCSDSSSEVSSLQSALSQAQQDASRSHVQIANLRAEEEQERSALSQDVTSCRATLARAEAPEKSSAQQVAALKDTIERANTDLEHERTLRQEHEEKDSSALEAKDTELSAKERELELSRKQLSAAQNELSKKESELNAKETELASLHTKLGATQAQAMAAETTRTEPSIFPNVVTGSYRAAEEEPRGTTTRNQAGLAVSAGTLAPTATMGALNAARDRAVQQLRSEISGGLAQLRMSVQTRDQLFAHFDQHGRSLQIKPSPLRTSSNATPDSIAAGLNNATTVRDLIQLRDDVHELDGKVDEDIALVRRMSGK